MADFTVTVPDRLVARIEFIKPPGLPMRVFIRKAILERLKTFEKIERRRQRLKELDQELRDLDDDIGD